MTANAVTANAMTANAMTAVAQAARQAQRRLAAAPPAARTAALEHLAELLVDRRESLLDANRRDLERAEAESLARPLLQRLALTPAKLDSLAAGLADLAAMEDPLGVVRRRTLLDDGLELRQVTSPLGVLLVIFESRPDAVVQIGALAVRSGNAVLLKGGSEARESNRALVELLRRALAKAGLPSAAAAHVEDRAEVGELLQREQEIDLVIPRGSNQLVRSIQGATRIPVLGHADGVCHLFLDADASPAQARDLAIDSKCDAPSACNAVETILVHRAFLPRLTAVGEGLTEAGVELRADDPARSHLPWARPSTDEDWGTEFGDLVVAIKTVDGLEEAIDHIHRFGSGHTDAIVTENPVTAREFLHRVDSASVFANASTRFADGYRYGLGAEVGISTGRIHARGPVGVDGLLTTRWLLEGRGHKVADYGAGGRAFAHRALPVNGG